MRETTLYAAMLLALGLFFYASATASAAPGDLDTTFNPDPSITAAWTVTTQSDGKVLVGCSFDALNPTTHGRVCRLNSDGTLDTTFFNNTGSGTNGQVRAIAVQFDGKILLGGTFSVVNGVSHHGLARLKGDGTLDATFQPVVGFGGPVNAIVAQPNGKILIGGRFDHVNDGWREGVARLNYDGSLDTSFDNVGSGGCPSFFSVSALALQPDEKIIAGGFFMMLNGATCKNMARVHFNSFHDIAFDNNLGPGAGFSGNNSIFALALAPGKIYIGGSFNQFNNAPRSGVARLNSNGTLDNTFVPTITAASGTPVVNALAVQTNGKILIGGSFAQVNGVARNNLARLNADGTLDQTFLNSGTGPNAGVTAIAIQPDGKILITGSFTQISGVPRPGVARLLGDAVPTPSPTPASPPVLLTQENTNRAVAFDSITFVRDPFPVLTSNNFSSDHHTRVMLFAANVDLKPEEDVSVITAQAEDSQQRVFPLTIEYAGKVPGFDWLTRINVRLPDELASGGDIQVSVRVRGVQSNTVLVSIKPPQ